MKKVVLSVLLVSAVALQGFSLNFGPLVNDAIAHLGRAVPNGFVHVSDGTDGRRFFENQYRDWLTVVNGVVVSYEFAIGNITTGDMLFDVRTAFRDHFRNIGFAPAGMGSQGDEVFEFEINESAGMEVMIITHVTEMRVTVIIRSMI